MHYLRLRFLAFAFLLFIPCANIWGDNLVWSNPNGAIWSNFYTSPYYAYDQSQNNQLLTIFCLDYNHEIAPPYDWTANLNQLAPGNTAQFQYGGSYPGVPGAPFAFQSDSATVSDIHGVTMQAGSDAYHRYLEAAWLFTNILDAQSNSSVDVMEVSQVAAWDLFVDSNHIADLRSRIASTGGTWKFTNYVAGSNQTISGLIFEDAVDEAVRSAQLAVLGGWAPSIGWSVVTGDANWIAANNGGNPTQEFLTPYVPNPEPGSLALFGSVAAVALLVGRRRMRTAKG
jgi:hypothetical protein